MTTTEIHEKTEEGKCPHCESSRIEEEGEKLVCMECGTVIENSVISSEQERFFSYEDVIKKGRHSFTSHYPETRSARRNLQTAKSLIKRLVNELHLPYFVGKDAMTHYRQLIQEKTVRKDILPSITAALVFLICRKSRISLPLERIAQESEAGKSDIMKYYQEIQELLKIAISPPSPEGLALRLAKKANLSSRTVAQAKKIAGKMKQNNSQIGKDPNGTAAAAVYTAAKRRNEDLTRHEIVKLASITLVTLRSQLEICQDLTF